MKHLKLFERFYYVHNELLDNLLSKWNVNIEDLEDLFIWFSDMGYTVQIRPNWFGEISDRTMAKKCIHVTILGINDFYSEEVMVEIRNVIKGLTNLGLYSDSPTRFENSRMMNFVINKIERIGESFNSSVKDLSWQEWDRVLTHMNQRFTPSEIEETIRVIEKCERETGTELVQNFGKVITPRIFNIRQYKEVPIDYDFQDGRVMLKNIDIYKKIKEDDPEWFYIHLENYETTSGNYFECNTFEDFLEKLESILLSY